MIVGVLGSGSIGGKVAIALSKAGHTVKIANSRGPETISEDIVKYGVVATWAKDAVQDVNAIVISLPPTAFVKIAPLLATVPKEVAILDTFNYYPGRDGIIKEIEDGKVESVWATEQLGRPVTKVWNTIFFTSFDTKARERGAHDRVALPIAGDNEEHRRIAKQLVSDTGFDGMDAGSLIDSWRQQPGAPCYCTDLTKDALLVALGKAERCRLPKRRDFVFNIFAERTQGDLTKIDADWAIKVFRLISLA